MDEFQKLSRIRRIAPSKRDAQLSSLRSLEERRRILQDRLHLHCKDILIVNLQIIHGLTRIVLLHPDIDRFSRSQRGVAFGAHVLAAALGDGLQAECATVSAILRTR